ncbi:methionine--tRNA ligase [Thiotrichales bacterium 19S3-7]|nr:methionine--tRNA ligase [Thiotrichales bacterium 19S3-7]MCF6800762.1 methionine--tRNA ligase [Thiotrichales bacterium 19S3-11]
MTEKRNILVTNALPYANAKLHLGHILGYTQSDIWCRFQTMKGHNCYYICGSDMHGTPIMLRAQQEGITPEALTEKSAKAHLQDFSDFGIAFDNYHSTHHSLNQKLVEEIYTKLHQKNLIKTKEVKQAFDPKADMFLPDRYVKGTCPKCKAEDQYGDSCEVCSQTYQPTELINPISVISGEKPILKSSEHYFFQLSQLQSSLKQWLADNKKLQPEVVNKLQEWFEQGLQDWDISRDAPYFGYKIPNTDNKYFYVWLDAPIGYLASFLDFCQKNNIDYDAFWSKEKHNHSEVYHFIGKDIIYFHTLFWPAMLDNADLRMPTSVYATGFVTVNGKKMSKSRGTFIQARTYLNHLNPEYLRYYYASKLTSRIDDIDLNLDDFIQKVNSDLVGKLVNIASRSANFIFKRFNAQLTERLYDQSLVNEFIAQENAISDDYEKREFASAIRKIMALADKANQFIDHHKPWQMIKDADHSSDVHGICSLALNLFKILMTYLKPVLPELTLKAEQFLNVPSLDWASIHKPLLNHSINQFKPLLARVEPSQIEAILEETKTVLEKEATIRDKEKTAPSNTLNLENEIQIDDFMKVDLRVAKIIEADHVEGADKLLRLKLDLGDVQKQVFAGIKSHYKPDDLIGRHTVMVANLKPRKMRFGLSEGMVLAAGDSEGIYLISPDEGVSLGARVK